MVAFAAVSCYVLRVCDATKIIRKCFGLQPKSVPLAPAFLSRLQEKYPLIFTACVQSIAVIFRQREDLITDSPHFDACGCFPFFPAHSVHEVVLPPNTFRLLHIDPTRLC